MARSKTATTSLLGRDARGLPSYSYTHDRAPPYLQISFVHSGYRAHLPLRTAVCSAFALHNETFDIWSHFMPALGFAALLCGALDCPISDGSRPAMLLYAAAHLGVFSVSTLAHTCHVVNARLHARLFQLDWSAIAVAIFAQLSMPVFFGTNCDSDGEARRLWLSSVLAVPCAALFIAANTPLWPTLDKPTKVAFTLPLAPCAAWTLREVWRGLASTEERATLFLPLLPPLGITLLGVTVYARKLPERWWPGRFDLIGHSHNWHHIWTTTNAILGLRNVLAWDRALVAGGRCAG